MPKKSDVSQLFRSFKHPLDVSVPNATFRKFIENRFPEDELTPLLAKLSAHYHRDQRRANGAPYFNAHIAPVSIEFLDLATMMGLNMEDIHKGFQSALLHDAWENMRTEKERKNVKRLLRQLEIDPDVLAIVEALTKRQLRAFKGTTEEREKTRVEEHLKNIDSLEGRLSKIALLVKLADRTHNIATLHYLSPKFHEEYLQETREHFIPFFEERLPAQAVERLHQAIRHHRALTLLKGQVPRASNEKNR